MIFKMHDKARVSLGEVIKYVISIRKLIEKQ